jgi:hypothetical protein
MNREASIGILIMEFTIVFIPARSKIKTKINIQEPKAR